MGFPWPKRNIEYDQMSIWKQKMEQRKGKSKDITRHRFGTSGSCLPTGVGKHELIQVAGSSLMRTTAAENQRLISEGGNEGNNLKLMSFTFLTYKLAVSAVQVNY